MGHFDPINDRLVSWALFKLDSQSSEVYDVVQLRLYILDYFRVSISFINSSR